jgi:hypothetical protein
VRSGPKAFGAGAAFGAIVLGLACNAIVGNGDIQFVAEAGAFDATTVIEASVESGAARVEASVEDAGSDALEAAALPEASAMVEAGCEAGTKPCAGLCVAFDDPAYGCGPTHCSPCELLNAVAGCAAADGGADGGGLACSVAVCKAHHADCNGTPLDGCETDTDGLYNCGACRHDCSSLPQVAGNVACVTGACTFDISSCAPGYGICSTNPDNGCDTEFSVAAHCGGCTTTCSGGLPDCSSTGNVNPPFACTSGCGAGLSLCGSSCVNEQSDPTHCGGCNTQCPAVAGGTATCSAGGVCGFTCNANDHRCGTGNAATCAANNDPNNCGVGAACAKCTAPANATSTCTGGTTCGYACIPGAHACASACVLNSDPNNCGSLCGTNCPGPTQGSGVASCDGNVCAITCSGNETPCNGTACVDEQADVNNCGSCGNTCGAGQACAGGQCQCNATSCPNGCCDGTGACQTVGSSGACGTAGQACVAGCPRAIPEAQSLAVWLIGDTYVSGAAIWTDQSGHADATCSTCPKTLAGALSGHSVVSFDGSSYFALGDPKGLFQTGAFTVFIVAAPDPTATSNAQLIAFSDSSGNALSMQRSSADPDILLQLLPGASSNSLLAPGTWSGTPEIITAGVDAASALLTVGTSTVTGSLGVPATVDYASSYLGTNPGSQSLDYTGQVAEVLVFNATLAGSSLSGVQSYLSKRYGL